jgi:hypothetical protein
MNTRFRAAGLCAFVILLARATSISAQLAEAGFVLSVRGDWLTSSDSSQRLSVGQALQDGDQIWASGRRSIAQSLSIALYADGGRLDLRCSTSAVCDRRYTIRAGRARGPRIREFLTSVAGLVRTAPDRYVPLITRGLYPPLREAVLASEPDGVDLAPALTGQEGGELRLEVTALDPADSTRRWSPLGVLWTPGTPALVPMATLPPGLFALRYENEPDTEAWILVRRAPASATDAANAEAIFGLVGEWSGGTGSKEARTVLRAYLHQLLLRSARGGHAP